MIPNCYLYTGIVESYVKTYIESSKLIGSLVVKTARWIKSLRLLIYQCVQQTLKKLDKNYISYFEKKKKDPKANALGELNEQVV